MSDTFIEVTGGIAQVEGNSGTTPFTYTVTRTGDLSTASSVDYFTDIGTLSGGPDASDFSGPITGTVFFASGESTKTITFYAVGDTQVEGAETFNIFLGNPTNANILNGNANGVIWNDDSNVVIPGVTITGTKKANNLFGTIGNDTIYGLAGNDTLDGQQGDDLLYGGANNDKFIFSAGFGHDVIGDFVKGGTDDSLAFYGLSAPTVVDLADGLHLNFSTGDTLVLQGVHGTLATQDWAFF